MEKQTNIQIIATFGGGLLFNYLFWMERQALNLILYSSFILIILLINDEIQKTKKFYYVVSSHLFASLLVVYNQSALTIITYYLSLFIFIGFVHRPLLRTIFAALLSALIQLATGPFTLAGKLINAKFGKLSLKPILRPIKYIIIPCMAIIFFSILYSVANPVFANYIEIIATNIGNFIENAFTFIFGDLSFLRFMHIILGILFTAGLIISFKGDGLEQVEMKAEQKLIRRRKDKKQFIFIRELTGIFAGKLLQNKMALKTENIIGIICFATLNLLILSLNIIDISGLWIGNTTGIKVVNYSEVLHEGTNALIFSIIMAMFVILYFFSGNLNFFSKNKTIKTLAYIWLIQNAFLVASVFLMDYNYIDIHGLTYKRIGVFVFLILCIVGLITVYYKVSQHKTLFYLLKTNGFIWYTLLLIAGFINWDVFIVTYNINNRDHIALDLDHLIDMSDKTLPLLDKNRDVLKKYVPISSFANKHNYSLVQIDTAVKNITVIDSAKLIIENRKKQLADFDEDLNEKIKRFNNQYEETSWLSWNFRDWQTRQYFISKKKD